MKIRRAFSAGRYLLLATFLSVAAAPGPLQAGMTDYCIVPPYVVQNIQPNVMIVVDTSGSMLNLAYSDGFHTTATSDDNPCTNSDNACTGFTAPGTYPSYKYYGYFNQDYWYTYSSSGGKFVQSAPKTGSGLSGARDKIPNASGGTEWDGGFLNWVAMRRIDVLRKVMTGGKRAGGEGTGWDKVEGEKSDCDARGIYKQITNSENYTQFTGTKSFTLNYQSASCDGGGSGISSFTVSGGGGTFNVRAVVPAPVTGVLQDVVGSRARIGLGIYNVNEGGDVRVNVGGGSLSSTVNEINNTRPFTNTPLAETLWSMTGYFAQQSSMLGGPGPRYSTSDYQISTSADPMNYGQGSTSRWPVCSKSFILYITDGEPCKDGNIPSSLADYANGRSDYNCIGGGCLSATKPITGGSFPASTFPSCGSSGSPVTDGYVAGIEDVALYMHTTDLRSDIANTQNLTLYAVFAFGKGSTLLRYSAINGGFEDDGTGTPNNQDTWDKNRDGEPDTFYEAADGNELEQAIHDAFSSILKRASSGTAASVLASGEGSGANLIQAVFYPRRAIGDDVIWWAGALQNLWYFVDPFFANATIREDTTQDNILDLSNDDIMQFYFNPTTQLTEVRRWRDTDGDGVANSTDNTVSFENVRSLWEAGKKLWSRDLSSSPRTIKTTLNGSTLIDFSVANASTLGPYLFPDTGDNVTTIIRYVTGYDDLNDSSLRQRTVNFGADNNVWKLGDIIDSTPRIVAGIPLNKYHTIYSDPTYATFIGDNSYKSRGMVFTGGNDGMLHAFRLGKLELSDGIWNTATQKARITNPFSGTVLGDEAWAFIPKNSLPYLKYLKDLDYCHLYYVDLSPYVFDASIGGNPTDVRDSNSWRTVLIGGMRYGGACANASTCAGWPTQDCVKTPATDNGYSSYFALNVTDPNNPELLWEFSNPNLGFTTTGPAVVRIDALNSGSPPARDRTLNGEWYVVLGSGPTGPIDNTNNQFLGRSNQNLRFFILNLKTGALVQTIDTGITNAFAGSMINSVADFDLDYQDDAIYAGYVKKVGSGSSATWTDGGVGRIVTKNATPGSTTPWVFSKVIDGTTSNPVGPVTSAVVRLQNKNFSLNWLYFGTGRYFFENPPSGTDTNPVIDDATGQRRLFGIKEPCFTVNNTINSACTSDVSFTDLTNVTTFTNVKTESFANSTGFTGWYIDLDGSANFAYDNTAARLFRSERVITDPLATTSGVVFFTTYKPYGDECALGGKSFLWALRYNTGGAPDPLVLKGKALVQVSTASVEQIDLSTAFRKDAGEGAGGLHKDERRTGAIEGVPPTSQGLSLLSQPPPVKRILHIKER